jgi:predicted TIM-barrel fold metal-dependent hydrolase
MRETAPAIARATARACEDCGVDAAAAFESIAAEVSELLPTGAMVVDAHTHLGHDEDGQELDSEGLLAALDEVAPSARACTFALHDPERVPAYRTPNDRVLRWAAQSGGRLYPYCRLDPADDPVAEAERCLAIGARGIKLHPRAQAFGFGDDAAESIWAVAEQAKVPILIHAGRGMPPMDSLADLALRHPSVVLVLAHGAIADQGMLTSRLRDHPNVLYDTSTFSVFDQLELFARVPAERIVFASDVPYGRPLGALHAVLRLAMYAGLDERERALVVGGTMIEVLEGRPLEPPRPPRVPEIRATSGRLARLNGYITMAFAAAVGSGPPFDFTRGTQFIALARAACRDPEPGIVGPAMERIDGLLDAAEQLLGQADDRGRAAAGLMMAAGVIAGTEPLARATT